MGKFSLRSVNDRYVPDLSLFEYMFAIFAVNLLIENKLLKNIGSQFFQSEVGLSSSKSGAIFATLLCGV